MNRRIFLKAVGITAGSLAIGLHKAAPLYAASMISLELPPLPYAFSDLEPHIDALTMEIHHNKHHKAYIDNLKKAIQGTKYEQISMEDMFKDKDLPVTIKNQAGGHYNHSLFWEWMNHPEKRQKTPNEKLLSDINKYFGSYDAFVAQFSERAQKMFGSGWCWLIRDKQGKLQISTTTNQDNPLMEADSVAVKGQPLLGLDIWEHAYYLRYQNKRADYIKAWWNVVEWKKVSG